MVRPTQECRFHFLHRKSATCKEITRLLLTSKTVNRIKDRRFINPVVRSSGICREQRKIEQRTSWKHPRLGSNPSIWNWMRIRIKGQRITHGSPPLKPHSLFNVSSNTLKKRRCQGKNCPCRYEILTNVAIKNAWNAQQGVFRP
jgi:hypothetical protein